jgi:hypothetical protein
MDIINEINNLNPSFSKPVKITTPSRKYTLNNYSILWVTQKIIEQDKNIQSFFYAYRDYRQNELIENEFGITHRKLYKIPISNLLNDGYVVDSENYKRKIQFKFSKAGLMAFENGKTVDLQSINFPNGFTFDVEVEIPVNFSFFEKK